MRQENDTTKRQECKPFTLSDRQEVERMLKSGANKREIASFHDLIGIHMTFSKSGANKREIARALRRDLSVVKREIKRGSVKQRVVKK